MANQGGAAPADRRRFLSTATPYRPAWAGACRSPMRKKYPGSARHRSICALAPRCSSCKNQWCRPYCGPETAAQSHRLLQQPRPDWPHAVPVRCSSGPVLEALRFAHADYFFAIQYKLSRQEWMEKNQLVYAIQSARWKTVLGQRLPVLTPWEKGLSEALACPGTLGGEEVMTQVSNSCLGSSSPSHLWTNPMTQFI